MSTATSSMAAATQEIAEAGTQGMSDDVVAIGSEMRIVGGLIDVMTADAVYTANATVARLSDGLFQDLVGTLDHGGETPLQ